MSCCRSLLPAVTASLNHRYLVPFFSDLFAACDRSGIGTTRKPHDVIISEGIPTMEYHIFHPRKRHDNTGDGTRY